MAATITITLTSSCAGSGHLHFNVTGAKTLAVEGIVDDVLDPVSDAEAQAFVKVIAKMAKVGKTLAQARTQLQSGVSVVVP